MKKKQTTSKSRALVPTSARSQVPAPLDPAQIYFNEVKKYPLLTRTEEATLAQRYFKGRDAEAAKNLVTSNLRLVVKIAMEYKRAYHNLLDLIQEGNLGLLKAVTKYDPNRGTKFSYYASWWIRAYILKYIIDNFKLVKIGTTQIQKKLFYNLLREKERIESMGVRADAEVLSRHLEVKPHDIVEMQQRLSAADISLDAPVDQHDDSSPTMDFLASTPATAEEQVTQDQLKQQLFRYLGEFVGSLSAKEKKIFEKRVYAEIPVTLQEIADDYGITRERIRQIETRVIAKLKGFFQKKGFAVGTRSLATHTDRY